MMIGGAELILAPEIRTPELTLRWIGRSAGRCQTIAASPHNSNLEQCTIHLRALSFRDQAAKIALWKFPAARFHSRN